MLTNDEKNVTLSTITAENERKVDEASDVEEAIATSGYGRFNVLLLLAALPIAWTAAFDTTSGGFILASAECDLRLTSLRKGVLVAFPYVAMLLTASLWSYVTDYVGRRSFFVVGLLADSILNVLSASVHSYHLFLLLKFISGIIVGGPFSMVAAYLTEFHCNKYNERFSAWATFLFTFPVIVPAVLGILILPFDWQIPLLGGLYKSWRVYLLVCSIPAMVGVVTASVLPDSPKYLIAMGKEEAALKLLKRMYAMNTGKPIAARYVGAFAIVARQTALFIYALSNVSSGRSSSKRENVFFKIKRLLAPQRNKEQLSKKPFLQANLQKIRLSLYNTKLLFSHPYLPAFCFINFLQFGSMLGFHTMRLWVPHLFIVLNNFDEDKWNLLSADRAPTMCEMLDRRATLPAAAYLNCTNFDEICMEWTVRSVIYRNSSVIASSAVFFSFLSVLISTTSFRKGFLLLASFFVSTVSSFATNWAQAPSYMLTLAATIIVTTRIAGNIVTAMNVDVIPIPLRASSVSIVTAIGNLGAITGNFLFSALLDVQCLTAFVGLAGLFAVCLVVSVIFLPKLLRISSSTNRV